MDLMQVLPPSQPNSRINSRAINSNTGFSDNVLRNLLVTSIKGERNDIIEPITNTMKDVYDYVFIDSGSPDSYLNADITTFTNNSIVFYNSTLFNNSSTEPITNGTNLNGDEDVGELIIMAVISIILGLMILITVIGNVFVIAAIILERNLQNVANYLVASLAVADLFVACLVMPLGAVYEISSGWILGPELCDIWTSCDVLCCTASILHLVAIATDRYWAVTNVDYMHSRTSRRVFMMIFLVWFAAVIVSLAPQFGWKDPEYLQRIEQQKCMVSQDISYQVFATCCTFYVPLLVILVLYWKIYQTARKRIHRRRPKAVLKSNNNNQTAIQPKIKTRLRFRIASKFTTQGRSAVSSLGLVEGNSTNTVNTVEDTEDSSNEHKSKIINSSGNGGSSGQGNLNGTGLEITTAFNTEVEGLPRPNVLTQREIPEDIPVKEIEIQEQINTVSQEVDKKQILETNCDLSNSNNNTQTINTNQLNLIVQSQVVQQSNQNLNNQIIISQASTPVQPSHHPHQQNLNQNISSISNPQSQVTKRKETLEAKRERKAAKTLAIITGAFVICWLPFFLMALLLPLCDSCSINDSIASLFLWLGYFNSTLNPVIYTIFSPEFRQAFKRILFGAHRSSNYYRGSRF